MKFKLTSIVIGVLAIVTLAACGGGEDSVSIYTHNVEDEMQPMVNDMEEEIDVSGDFLNVASEEGYSRASEEFPDVGAEVQRGQLHSLVLLADKEDMLGSYKSREREDVTDEYNDQDGKW